MKRILCFGDSNTYGHNPLDASRLENRWTRMIAADLGDEIIEEGLCARTTVFESGQDSPMCVGERMLEGVILTHKPFDLLIIMLGTNDLIKGCGADIEASAAGLDKLITIAESTYPDAQILVVSPIQIDPSVVDNSTFGDIYGERGVELSKSFARYYKPVAEKHGCHFMNAADYAKASKLDGVHMDEANHRKLADAIEDKIREIFK